MYSFKLIVANSDLRVAYDVVQVMVTSTLNVPPTVSLTAPADNSTFTQGKPVTVSATASDFDGAVTEVDFYQGSTLIASATTTPYSVTWNPMAGNYAITAKATDNAGAVSTSQPVNITIAPLMSCTTTSAVSTQGTFSVGYKCTYETVGTNVTVSFELLDTDKPGLVAYLWKQTPFSETSMTNTTGKVFTSTLSGQTSGAVITYACKFAYAGGMSVTKYTVGSNCTETAVNNVYDVTPFFYPNPVRNTLHLQLTGENNRVIVSDMLGKRVFNSNVPSVYNLDMSTVDTGIYFIRVENANGILNGKVIKK